MGATWRVRSLGPDVFTDPRHRASLIQLWTDRFDAWLNLPSDLDAETRARFLVVRLLADGIWYAESSGVFPLSDEDRAGVSFLSHRLLSE